MSSHVFRPLHRAAPATAASLLAMLMAMASAATTAADQAADERAVRTASQTYKNALERGDSKTLAALWMPDGDIIDDAGRVMKGSDTVAMLEPLPTESVKTGRPEVAISETSLRFITPDVAVEDGTVKVVHPGHAAPLHGRFSATWVRHADAWKLSAIREARGDQATGPETLADLAWMVGDWVVVDEPGDDEPSQPSKLAKPSIAMSVRWNPSRTYLLRDLKITPAGGPDSPAAATHITQRIGWDPLSRSIRSWVFSEDGGHGEASWSRDDGSWVARTTAVLPDGSQTSSINIYSYDGKDRCVWRSLPTHVGGEHMPQVNMTMIRKSGSETTEGTGR
ncbi:MAG: nuclear transport factor 2 family protein [Planctomycetia bacterium]|nr:nuclear transport factor 2 family protein [Planctomycetia bacterium]